MLISNYINLLLLYNLNIIIELIDH